MGEQLKEVSTKAGLASAAKRERDQYAEMFSKRRTGQADAGAFTRVQQGRKRS